MLYPAQIQQEDKVFIITFKDVPEAMTQGYTWLEALDMAEDALKTAIEFYTEDDRPIPCSSVPASGDVMIPYGELIC
jgi:antitoxin HicB